MSATPKEVPDKSALGNTRPVFGKNQPKHYCGKKGRSGPPIGTRNNLRHGLKSGQLPPGAKYIEHRLNALRRTLEDALIALNGEVTINNAAHIQSALRWERHAALAQRWLTKQYDELKPADRIKFSESVARASDCRDKAIRALNLDRDNQDNVLDALYSRPTGNGDN